MKRRITIEKLLQSNAWQVKSCPSWARETNANTLVKLGSVAQQDTLEINHNRYVDE